MSNNILLTKFTFAHNGKLTEKDSKNIGSCFFPEEILKSCIANNYFCETLIYEDDLDSKYQMFYINSNNLEKVLMIVMELINNNCKTIIETKLSEKESSELHNNNYILYNLRNLIQMKTERFFKNDEILLIYEGEISKEENENA